MEELAAAICTILANEDQVRNGFLNAMAGL